MARASLEEQLSRLATLSPAALRAEWETLHGSPCPKLAPALLQLGLAHRLQEQASGKRGRSTTRVSATRPAKPSVCIPPGTQLVRSWNGRTVSVVAEEHGFLFGGRSYPSLSAIAREVTGAHWSGPRFFGLAGSRPARG